MRFEELPTSAQAIVARIAGRYGLEPGTLLAPRQRTTEAKTARTQAICALDEAKLNGVRRYSLPDIARWFAVSRNSIYAQRSKAPNFTPRRTSSLTA